MIVQGRGAVERDGSIRKHFSARNGSAFIAACVAVNAARRFQEPGPELGFLCPFRSPAIARGFFSFRPYACSLLPADGSDVGADLI